MAAVLEKKIQKEIHVLLWFFFYNTAVIVLTFSFYSEAFIFLRVSQQHVFLSLCFWGSVTDTSCLLTIVKSVIRVVLK